jgi:hypothetical protein
MVPNNIQIASYIALSGAMLVDSKAIPTMRPSTFRPTTFSPTPPPSTRSPTLESTVALYPTTEPTNHPSMISTIPPMNPPTLDPTASPSALFTSRPTNLRGSTMPTLSPSAFPSIKLTNVAIKKRVKNVFKQHEDFLLNRNITKTIDTFLEIETPSNSQLTAFKKAINNYKNGLGADNVWLFLNIDNLLTSVENESKLQQVGLTDLSENFHTESSNGINHFVTVSSALGSKNISSVIHDGSKDITGIIGNHTLSGITLVNITSSKPGSISAAFTSLKTSISNAIGYLMPLHLKSDIIISACSNDHSAIIDSIYNISTTPTLLDTINGFVACNAWVHNYPEHHITKTDLTGCTEVIGINNALSTCVDYLNINSEL